MKSVKQINIERLTKRDKSKLEAVRMELHRLHADIVRIGAFYEGRLHTQMDRLELEVVDCIEVAERILGNKKPELELLSESDNLKPIVKSSV